VTRAGPAPSPGAGPCPRCSSPIEAGDLRCAVCAMALPAPPVTAEAARASVLRCTECGAAISFSAEVQAPHCSFCGATMEIEHPVDPVEKAEAMLPFVMTRDAAQAELRTWMSKRGWLHPRDLAAGSTVAKLEPLYWAGWLIEARATVSWAADSDHDSWRSSWAPHAGQVPMSFDGIVVPASRGLTLLECTQLTPHYDLRSGRPLGGPPPGDGAVEEFDMQRSAARRTVLDAIEATAVGRLQQGAIPGRRFRHVRASVYLQGLRTWRVALPAWVLAYRYRGRLYRAVVHGQKAGLVVGKAPYSRAKVMALMVAGAALVALIVAAATGALG